MPPFSCLFLFVALARLQKIAECELSGCRHRVEDKWTISHLFVYVCLLYFFVLLVSVFCIFFCNSDIWQHRCFCWAVLYSCICICYIWYYFAVISDCGLSDSEPSGTFPIVFSVLIYVFTFVVFGICLLLVTSDSKDLWAEWLWAEWSDRSVSPLAVLTSP